MKLSTAFALLFTALFAASMMHEAMAGKKKLAGLLLAYALHKKPKIPKLLPIPLPIPFGIPIDIPIKKHVPIPQPYHVEVPVIVDPPAPAYYGPGPVVGGPVIAAGGYAGGGYGAPAGAY